MQLQDIMTVKFNEIKHNFICASKKNGLGFNEDIFIDSYIKCNETLKNKNLDENEIIKYFWVSYCNNIKKEFRNNKHKCNVEISESFDATVDEDYDDRKLVLYDTIITSVKEKYSELEYTLWYLHFVEKKSYESLVDMGYKNINFHNLFRNINYYIKNKLPNENTEYNNIIKDLFG